jgi:hypothetical protein
MNSLLLKEAAAQLNITMFYIFFTFIIHAMQLTHDPAGHALQ